MTHRNFMDPALADVLDRIGGKPSRFDQQLALERQLVTFNADEQECSDMLGALLGEHGKDDEVAHYAGMLRKALERLEYRRIMRQPDEDSAYENWLARRDEP